LAVRLGEVEDWGFVAIVIPSFARKMEVGRIELPSRILPAKPLQA